MNAFFFLFSPTTFLCCQLYTREKRLLTQTPDAVVNDSGVYLPVTYSPTALASSYIREAFLREELIWAMHI